MQLQFFTCFVRDLLTVLEYHLIIKKSIKLTTVQSFLMRQKRYQKIQEKFKYCTTLKGSPAVTSLQ